MWRKERESARPRHHRTTGPHPRHVTDITGTNHFTTQAKNTLRPPPCPLSLCISPLFKFMAVVCKIYLCMYLYSIYVLVGHKNVVFCILFFFLFWRTFYFKKCGKMRMLNHGDEVGEYTWTQASCDVDFFCMHSYVENDVHRVYTSFSRHRHFFYFRGNMFFVIWVSHICESSLWGDPSRYLDFFSFLFLPLHFCLPFLNF